MTVAEMAEVFQLGGTLAEIRTTLGFVKGTVEKTDLTVTDTSGRVGNIEVILGRHEERIGALESRPATEPIDAPSMSQFVELKDEVKSGRLTWPKIALLITALVGLFALMAIYDAWTPGT